MSHPPDWAGVVIAILSLACGGLLAGLCIAIPIFWPLSVYRGLIDIGGGAASPNRACLKRALRIDQWTAWAGTFCMGFLAASVVPWLEVLVGRFGRMDPILLLGSGIALSGLILCLAFKVMLFQLRRVYVHWPQPYDEVPDVERRPPQSQTERSDGSR
jgi:hypothetical protein